MIPPPHERNRARAEWATCQPRPTRPELKDMALACITCAAPEHMKRVLQDAYRSVLVN